MPKIVVKRKDEKYKEFFIQPSQCRISVGSESDNDLIIADKEVSQYHLLIIKEGNQFFVEDQNSTAGTFLNNEKIEGKAKLSNGDCLVVGEHDLIFENELFEAIPSFAHPSASENETNAEEIKHNLELKNSEEISPVKNNKEETNSIPKAPQLQPTKTRQSEQSFVPHSLLAIYGPYIGKKWELKPGITKIGRDEMLNDIVIRETKSGEIDSSVSRRHATIIFEDGNFFISDKRSKTRTRVNQKQLDEDGLIQLTPQDEIQIVSDQDSTILRFVETGTKDFSRPKKAGFWWDRNAHRLGKDLSAILAILLLVGMFFAYQNIRLTTLAPSTLTFAEKKLFAFSHDDKAVSTIEEIIVHTAALTPAVADLNDDNFLDIVFLDRTGHLFVVNGKTYQPLWKDNFQPRAQLPLGITLADINNDNTADIFVPAQNSKIYALDGSSGNEIWASPILGGTFSGNPVVSDLNGDDLKDVFICHQSGTLSIGFGGFGNPDWESILLDDKIDSPPAAADINNDRLPEVIFASEKGFVYVYSGSERKIINKINLNQLLPNPQAILSENHPFKPWLAAGRLNTDHFDDMLVLTEGRQLLAYDVANDRPIWRDTLTTSSHSGAAFPTRIADVNGDKRMDVVVVTRENKIIIYDGLGNGNGLMKRHWDFIAEQSPPFISFPVVADLNKDLCQDIVLANSNGAITIVSGADGKLLNEVTPMNPDSAAIIGTPIVADMNSNGWLDILFRKNGNSFSIFESNIKVKNSSILWGQLNLNAEQNGSQPRLCYQKILCYLALIISTLILLLLFFFNLIVSIKRNRLIKQRA